MAFETGPNSSEPLASTLGKIQLSDTSDDQHHPTISELANFVLNDQNVTMARSTSEWLQTLHHNQMLEQPGLVENSFGTSNARSVPKDSGSSFEDQEMPYSRPGNLPALEGSSTLLDGSALAMAIGMPTRYGQVIVQCLDHFFCLLYPTFPIIYEARFRALLAMSSQLGAADRALLAALCSMVYLHPSSLAGLPLKERKELGVRFLEKYLLFHSELDYPENYSLHTILASFFVSIAYSCLSKFRASRSHLREAVGQALDLGLQDENFYEDMEEIDAACHRRTLALLFMTERGGAMLAGSPMLMIMKPPYLPNISFSQDDRRIFAGFQELFKLFSYVDERFIDLWAFAGASDLTRSEAIRDYICSTQASLDMLTFHNGDFTDSQRADVLITHQWLRLILWQTTMRHSLLSSRSPNLAFTYRFPLKLGTALCKILRILPRDALAIHGLGCVSSRLLYQEESLFDQDSNTQLSISKCLRLRSPSWILSHFIRVTKELKL